VTDEMEQVARAAMAAKVLGDAVKEHGAPARRRLAQLLAEGRIERRAVDDDDGTKVGTVSLGAGKTTARVVDEAKFLDYVSVKYPGEIVGIVSPDFRQDLLEVLTKNRSIDDPNASEPTPVPGVELVTSDPYPIVRPNDEGRARARALLADSGLLAIEGAGDE
jgi:hypothetical protein